MSWLSALTYAVAHRGPNPQQIPDRHYRVADAQLIVPLEAQRSSSKLLGRRHFQQRDVEPLPRSNQRRRKSRSVLEDDYDSPDTFAGW